MYRILVDPEKLASLALTLREAASELDQISNHATSVATNLDWDVQYKSDIEGLVEQVRRRKQALAAELDGLAIFLERKARDFAEADQQGMQWVKRIANNTFRAYDAGFFMRLLRFSGPALPVYGFLSLISERFRNWLKSGHWFTYRKFQGQLFVDGPELEDIKQGKLGDCYLIAAMGAVAQRDPDIIRRMIRNNGDGTYTVTFHELDANGHPIRPVEVVVDGKLPTKDGKSPCFASSSDKGELWPAIIERAYTKWKGGEGDYEDIEGGISSRAVAELTGYPTRQVSLQQYKDSPDRVLDMIKNAIDNGHPIVAGGAPKRVAGAGVVAHHSYVVEGVTPDGKIILRNPWGPSVPKVELTPNEFCKYYGYMGISGA